MQHIVHRFTGSGPNQLARFENDLDRYVKELNSYSEEQYKIHHDEEKNKSNGSVGLQLTLNDKGFLEIANITGYDQSTIDLSTMPRFKPTAPTWQSAVSGSIADMLVLIAYSIIFILISVVAFLRYDVR